MRSLQIYIENQIIDLFNDEQIVVNSTVQNISDISKVFTDFSQSFTIPCSPRNNTIFEHYYNNDVDNTIDHNRRRDARIEINYVPFKEGKIQLEKSVTKNGQAESYTVTFYGSVVNLKDILLEDKLRDIDYSTINHTYSGAEIQTRIETDPSVTDYDVKYPLISSSRVWQYGSADSRDISDASYPIGFNELFPAVRIKTLLDAIGTTYGITFSGSWLDTEKFTKAFLWFKNKETYNYYAAPNDVVFTTGISTDVLYDSKINLSYIEPSSLYETGYNTVVDIKHWSTFNISTASTANWGMDVYINGELTNTYTNTGSQTYPFNQTTNDALFGSPKDFSFKLRANLSGTFDGYVAYRLSYTLYPDNPADPIIFRGSNFWVYDEQESFNTITNVLNTDLASLAPDIKIIDLITGLFNQFNLTCYGQSTTDFLIEPLETYYSKGGVYDITKYTDFSSIDFSRPKLYNKVLFKYQDSQSFMNREFFDLFGREYGSLDAVFGYDGGDFVIQSPFESLLHSKFTDTELQVGYCLGTEPEYKNYVPKPVILYQGDYQVLQDFYFLDSFGGSATNITEYVPFGQDASYTDENYSLNFGADISSLTEEVELNSLYAIYYESYLNNLFNGKTRITTVKCNLPINLIRSIDLNDSVLIKDKKYIINSMQTNLTSGEVNLELLSSWREESLYGAQYIIDFNAQDVLHPFSVGSSTTIVIGSPLETQFATPDDYTPTGDQLVTFACTENTSGETRINTFPLTITQNGVAFPTQYIIIIQTHVTSLRILEQAPPFKRVTEDGIKRETE